MNEAEALDRRLEFQIAWPRFTRIAGNRRRMSPISSVVVVEEEELEAQAPSY
jgi:hypothetical protein